MKTTEENWKRFGRWVAQKREGVGLAQADLANRIERDRQTVYRIENGDPTKRTTVVRIAEALGQPSSIALDIAFGATAKETASIPDEREILGYLKDLPVELRKDFTIMLRALALEYRNRKTTIPIEFENIPEIDGSDAPAEPEIPASHGVLV